MYSFEHILFLSKMVHYKFKQVQKLNFSILKILLSSKPLHYFFKLSQLNLVTKVCGNIYFYTDINEVFFAR